jgi:hypoxanthine phosphoribosyltransferase
MISHALDLPFMSFDPHWIHLNSTVKVKFVVPLMQTVPEQSTVLLVDDIADTGKVLSKTKAFFEKDGFAVAIATVYYKKSSIIEPTIWECDGGAEYITFPYEKKEE